MIERTKSRWIVNLHVLMLAAIPSFANAGSFSALFQENRSFGNPGARVSADGGTVISYPETGGDPAVWDRDSGVRRFPRNVFLRGVSSDGSVIVGSSPNGRNGPPIATAWESGGSVKNYWAGITSYAWDVSGDGSTVAGGFYDGISREAAVWKNGLLTRIDPDGGSRESTAYALSDDGSTAVGLANIPGSPGRPFVWTEDTGFQTLQSVAGAEALSGIARGVSGNGQYVVGDQKLPAVDQQAFLWTNHDGMKILDDLEGGPTFGSAFAVTKGAERIVGTGRSSTGQEAVIWEANRQPQKLESYLTDNYGIDLTGWLLRVATDITPDGSVIIGTGQGPDGNEYVWRAEITSIPEPSSLLLAAFICVHFITAVRHAR